MHDQLRQSGPSQAPPGPRARPARSGRVARLKRFLLGHPLETERLAHERLGKPTALAVFASDNLSSSAYATEEILRVLLITGGVGTLAFARVIPITIALLAVLAVLLFSYRQTIRAYPQAGGAYLVTRDNFGLLPAQIAGIALLTDYILTVSVSVAAGTAALTSLAGSVHPYRVPIAVGFVVLLAAGNLRGVREAGRLFAAPTYFFILMMGTLLAVGAWKAITGTLADNASQFPLPETKDVAGFALVFLILKAFASGGAAVTGVEAISNGVPAFRAPEWRNARTTLMWMGGILGTLFLGLSILASRMQIGVDEHEKVTVVSQIARGVFGSSPLGTVLFAMLQIGTLLILVLAANTSFADFPRLASFQASDRFLPRQLTRHGDRLVFSNGVIVLASFAILLLIVFKASVTNLIPLYAIGVFTSFTFSQSGMAKRHFQLRKTGWRAGLAINGLGAVVTAVMTIVIAVVKFTSGAYIILIAVPVILAALLKVHGHYEEAGKALRDPARIPPLRDTPRQRVVIPIGQPSAEDAYAVAYASRVFPLESRMVHFGKPGDQIDFLIQGGPLTDVVELHRARGTVASDLVRYVRQLRAEVGANDVINVIIPETVKHAGFTHLFRKWHVQQIKAALVAEAGTVVTNIAHHPLYAALEPVDPGATGDVMEGWHHVAVVLVSGVHNATAQSLRYARSLRADELHCLHVAVDQHETETVLKDWRTWDLRVPLEVVDSPYRQIERPIHDWVRRVLDARPKTFVTIVIPEFVVRTWWHQFMHNQTALTLKGAFLFEPSVVVSSVPYAL